MISYSWVAPTTVGPAPQQDHVHVQEPVRLAPLSDRVHVHEPLRPTSLVNRAPLLDRIDKQEPRAPRPLLDHTVGKAGVSLLLTSDISMLFHEHT